MIYKLMPQINILRPIKDLMPLWHSLSRKRRRQLIILQVLAILAAFSEVVNLGALLPFLQLLANPASSLSGLKNYGISLGEIPNQQLLIALGFTFIIAVIISSVLRILTITVQLRLSALITNDLAEKVFSNMLSKTFQWHLSINSSESLSYLTRDVGSVYGCIQSTLVFTINFLIVITLTFSIFILSPALATSISVVMLSFYCLVFYVTRSRLANAEKKGIFGYQNSLKIAQEALGGIRDVLIDDSKQTFVDSYSSYDKMQRLAGAEININAQIPRYFIEGMAMIVIVAVSLYLALMGQGIDKLLPLIGTLSLGAYRLLQPLQQCFGFVTTFQSNRFALKRLKPFLVPNMSLDTYLETFVKSSDNNIAILDEITNVSHYPFIELNNVSFSYSSDSPAVLNNLSISIKQGERLALIGQTGSGKSTTSDLILGLLRPSSGTIKINGIDLHSNPEIVKSWHKQISHVPQSIYLSDGSFAENIAFGIPLDLIDMQRVRFAAFHARIAELIEESPNKYMSLIGERGVRLSGGQRQRIGIARALYKQAKLLVLDEATSALDNKTEADVMSSIERLNKTITVVMIAHRLSTIERCDRIIVIKQGRIEAIGTYQQLKETSVAFAEISNNLNLQK